MFITRALDAATVLVSDIMLTLNIALQIFNTEAPKLLGGPAGRDEKGRDRHSKVEGYRKLKQKVWNKERYERPVVTAKAIKGLKCGITCVNYT